MKYTPMIADSETVETLKLAEEISTFFEDQKLKAQDRIRQCEAFINNLHLPSKSVKEGMFLIKLCVKSERRPRKMRYPREISILLNVSSS